MVDAGTLQGLDMGVHARGPILLGNVYWKIIFANLRTWLENQSR